MTVPTTKPLSNTLISTPELPSAPSQQGNLQELLSAFENIETIEHFDYNSPQVTTT